MRYQSTAVAMEERNAKNPPKFFAYGELKFKAKVDGQKVLEMKANDFSPYFGD